MVLRMDAVAGFIVVVALRVDAALRHDAFTEAACVIGFPDRAGGNVKLVLPGQPQEPCPKRVVLGFVAPGRDEDGGLRGRIGGEGSRILVPFAKDDVFRLQDLAVAGFRHHVGRDLDRLGLGGVRRIPFARPKRGMGGRIRRRLQLGKGLKSVADVDGKPADHQARDQHLKAQNGDAATLGGGAFRGIGDRAAQILGHSLNPSSS